MNREVHVRFWESPEVKALRATRPSRHVAPPHVFCRKRGTADMEGLPASAWGVENDPSASAPGQAGKE
jgi:hypothetical protein